MAVIEVKETFISLYHNLIFLLLMPYSKDAALNCSLLSYAFPGYRSLGGAFLINEAGNEWADFFNAAFYSFDSESQRDLLSHM
jgi:hypothetical protein